MMSWWKSAKLEDAIGAWAPFAGRIDSPEVDARFRAAIWQIGPATLALVMGYRLSSAHGHLESGQCPGPYAAVWAYRAGFPGQWRAIDDYGVGIASIASHCTGTGRLRWEAKCDGTIRIEVWRGPSAGSDPSLVLSAIVRASPRNDEYNDGIECECVEVEGHAPFGVRHVEVLIGAIAAAMANDYTSFEHEAIRARLAALGTPEPDPWDPSLCPEPLPAGSRVQFGLGDYGIATGEATGETPEWGQYERSWGQWVKADHDGNRWFVPVDDIKSVEGGGA